MDNRIRSISFSSLNHDHTRPELPPPVEQSPSWLLGEILQQFQPKSDENDVSHIIKTTNSLIDLLRQNPDIKQDLVIQNVINKIGFMCYSPDSTVKACGYRILKTCISNEDSLYVLIQNKVLIYLIISLSMESTSDLEKLYAVKLIQKFLVINNGCNYLSIGIIKSLVHLLDDDLFIISNHLKALIVEVLLEISLFNPKLIYHANGFNLLTRNLVNNTNIVVSINSLFIIVNLLNVNEFNHNFFRNGYNLNALVSVFDEESLQTPSKSKTIRLQKVSFLLTTFLKNWNGFLCCSLNNFQILRDLINNLNTADNHDDWRLKEFILDILLDVLNIKSLPWLRNSVIGEFLLNFNPNARFIFNHNEILDTPTGSEAKDFEDEINNDIINHYINHYVGLFSFILIKLNLIDLLHSNLHNSHLNDKVILLLSNLFKFSKLYLPPEFNLQLSYKIDLNSLIKISNYNLNSSGDSSNLIAEIRALTTQSVLSQNPDTNMDDTEFKAMINATRVPTIKEFASWDWNLLLKLFQGPLTQEKKFSDLLKTQPKFFKRLLSYYRPFKARFCNSPLKSTRQYKKIIQVGILMFQLLSTHVSGLRYFYKNKIIIQMAECLAQIDPYSGIKARNAILSEQNLHNTVNIGYVKFLGKLTESDNGIQILNHWQIFQLLNNIVASTRDSESNNYFILQLFKSISLTHSKQSVNLLARCLNTCNTNLKLKLVDLFPLFQLDKLTETKLIINNIYQRELSTKLVNKIYQCYLDQNKDPDYLKLVLSFNPPISVLSKSTKGCILLDQFLLLPEGFEYLSRFNFIEVNFQAWLRNKNNFLILKYYESKLNEKLFPYFKFTKGISYNYFLKHLLDTKEGLNYFQGFNVAENFMDQLLRDVSAALTKLEEAEASQKKKKTDDGSHDHGGLSEMELRNLKQNLWILGEINCSNYGIQLMPFEFFESLIQFHDNCSDWTIKSLLFYQIGKLALNNEGIEILDENKWLVKFNKFIKYENFGYPAELDLNYFHNDSQFEVNFERFDKYQMYNIDELTEEEMVVIELIFKFPSNLMKLDKRPTRELTFLKKNHGSLFNVDFFLKVIKFIDNSNFNFKKRNFIFGLFVEDSNILELLLKKRK